MLRKDFIKNLSLGVLAFPLAKNSLTNYDSGSKDLFKISLAQFSLFRLIRSGEMKPYDFAKISSELGFKGLEYMSALYKGGFMSDSKFSLADAIKFANKSNSLAKEYNQENVLIMVDVEGNLSSENSSERATAIENHYKWIDCANRMGCHSIRVNLYGSNDPDTWKKSSQESLNSLCEYAKDFNLNIIVENHNGLSSNPKLLVEVIKSLDFKNCGTLPDFGNWCITQDEEKRNELYALYQREKPPSDDEIKSIGDICIEKHDPYKGMEIILPYAKGVSAKSQFFDLQGNESSIDYNKMLSLVIESGYKGYIGVEYGGFLMSPIDGTIATKNLLNKTLKNLV